MTQQKRLHCILCFTVYGLLNTGTYGDTLYLKDSSVLKGNTRTETATDTLLSNPLFGEVAVLNDDILYHEIEGDQGQRQVFTLVDNGAWVLAHLSRTVPLRQEQSERFSLMIPGDVQAVLDNQGQTVPISQRSIAGNTLLSVNYEDLTPDTERLLITTQRTGLLYQQETGRFLFKLKHIPNEEQDIKIILRYPTHLKALDVDPTPSFTGAGLVIWEQSLRRQQRFEPQVQFGL